MSQLPLGPWAPPEPDAQPARESRTKGSSREAKPPRERARSRRDREADGYVRPATPAELAERNRREHEAIIRRKYTPFGVEPPRIHDVADQARADREVQAVLAERRRKVEAAGGGTWFYGTFMTWAEYEAEFERREGRKPGEPLTAEQRRRLTWRGGRR
jgi:hypothetical protein